MNSVTYILYSNDIDYCVLIDCGEWETLRENLLQLGKSVRAVLLTHGHSDHIYGLNGLIKEYPSLVVGSNEEGHLELNNPRKNLSLYHEMPFTVNGYNQLVLHDGMVLRFEGLADIQVISTPGHSPSCLTYKVENNLFTGDAYIPGIKTITGFPGGNKELALKSLSLILKMEKQGFNIYCGHHSY